MALSNDELILLDNSIKKVLGTNNNNFTRVRDYIITKVNGGIINTKDIQFRINSVIREAISNTLPLDKGDVVGIKVIDNVTYQGDGEGRYVELNTNGGGGGSNSSGSVNSVNGQEGDVIITKNDLGLDIFDRPDKVLQAMDIAKVYYDSDINIIKLQYGEVSDVNYETFTYVDGDLANVKHYIDGVLKGTTILNKNVDGELDSTTFIGA